MIRTVRGKCEGKTTIGQIFFCDLLKDNHTNNANSLSTQQSSLLQLIPAIDLVTANSNCMEEDVPEPTTLPAVLTVCTCNEQFGQCTTIGCFITYYHVNTYYWRK